VEQKMRFPKTISHYKAEVKIYGKKKNYPFYRIVYRLRAMRRLIPPTRNKLSKMRLKELF